MSIQIESDLVKILEKIEFKIDKLDGRLLEIEKSQVRLEEKVEGLSKRVDDQAFINKGVLVGLIIAIAGGAAKLFGFAGNFKIPRQHSFNAFQKNSI